MWPSVLAEYATVMRLSKMLETAKEDYKAVETYALFTFILCWVMQRSRTALQYAAPDNLNAQSVKAKLKATKAGDAPWSVTITRNISTFQLFEERRNAVAHGDAQRIRPFNEGGWLKGYIFDLRETKDGPVVDRLRLLHADMARLGTALADVYCTAMSAKPGQNGIAEEATRIQETQA